MDGAMDGGREKRETGSRPRTDQSIMTQAPVRLVNNEGETYRKQVCDSRSSLLGLGNEQTARSEIKFQIRPIGYRLRRSTVQKVSSEIEWLIRKQRFLKIVESIAV